MFLINDDLFKGAGVVMVSVNENIINDVFYLPKGKDIKSKANYQKINRKAVLELASKGDVYLGYFFDSMQFQPHQFLRYRR